MAIGELISVLQLSERPQDDARQVALERLDGWLARGYEPPPSLHDEARLIAAARWMLNERPDHPVLPVWTARAPHLLRELDDHALAAQVASFVFEHAIRVGDFVEAGRLVAEMWDRTSSDRRARLAWLPSAARYLWLTGRMDGAQSTLKHALREDDLSPSLRYALLEQAASACLVAGDDAGCLAFLGAAEARRDALTAMDRAHIAFLRAGAAVLRGDGEGALVAMQECEDQGHGIDARFFRALWRLGAATLRARAGQPRRSERELTALLGDVVLMRARYLEFSVRLARAGARLAQGRNAAAESDLGTALRIASENGYVNCDPWGLTPEICALLQYAVEHGIDARTARLILAHRP